MTSTATLESTSTATSTALAAIERAWDAIRVINPDIQAVRFALPSRAAARARLGHHFAGSDDGFSEVAIYSGAFAGTGEQLLGVLLHEAAHHLAHQRDITETSPSSRGRWHNADFANLAAEMGLHLDANRPADLGAHTLAPVTKVAYTDTITDLDAALAAYSAAFGDH